MTRTDEQLVEDYLKGDELAFRELLSRYLKSVYNFVFRFSKSQGVAEDITQDVFIKVWKNIKGFKKELNFKTWIFSIARNTTIDWMRKKKESVFSDFIDDENGDSIINEVVDNEPLPDELFTKVEDEKTANDLINSLPLIYQEIMILRYKEDLTFDEIGKVLKKPLNTVKSQHQRAIVILRKKIDAPKNN